LYNFPAAASEWIEAIKCIKKEDLWNAQKIGYSGYTMTKGTRQAKGPLGTHSVRKRLAGEGYEVEEEGEWQAIHPVCLADTVGSARSH
jgi:hypothetical protein